ncbi:hypothetical protein [Haloarcula halophila]|uniref:hypothetical protein n=1 Tax=Haloarcula TaxID=2237 RepID=UPI0023E35FA5|nr:hypothetical protein [Halomicroarcula sp. DFY41]
MDRRGIAEVVGAALVSGGIAVAGLRLFAGEINWLLVIGLVASVSLAAAANYRGRTGHAEQVAAEAPDATAEAVEAHAPDRAGEGGEPLDRAADRSATERDD